MWSSNSSLLDYGPAFYQPSIQTYNESPLLLLYLTSISEIIIHGELKTNEFHTGMASPYVENAYQSENQIINH